METIIIGGGDGGENRYMELPVFSAQIFFKLKMAL